MSNYLKVYIAVLDEVPDHMVPVLVAHSILWAHTFKNDACDLWNNWLHTSFRKCVVKVPRKEFNNILTNLPHSKGHENSTLNGETSCLVVDPVWSDEVPKVLKFAKLWKPS